MIAGAIFQRKVTWLSIVAFGVVCTPSLVLAQTPAREQVCCVLTVGATWAGSVGFPDQDANESDANGKPYFLFGTQSSLASTIGFHAHLATKLTNQLSLEFGASYATPELHVELSDDIEGAAPVTAVERIFQVQVDVALIARLRRQRAGVRTMPFLSGGAGISRELHEGHTLVENAPIYFVGGGLTHVLTENQRRTRALGIRIDGRVMLRHHGAALDDRVHALPVLAASAFLRF